MDYPKDKLDVKILVEEKDEETLSEARRLGLFGEPETVIEPMTAEQYREFLKTFEVVIVPAFEVAIIPDADIRTKPRACNYGLFKAKGEYCVIYDAEDDPEPDQLKKAVIAFSRVGKDCICLQSRLNFYNPKENLLTRWFSLEYSYWFDLSGRVRPCRRPPPVRGHKQPLQNPAATRVGQLGSIQRDGGR